MSASGQGGKAILACTRHKLVLSLLFTFFSSFSHNILTNSCLLAGKQALSQFDFSLTFTSRYSTVCFISMWCYRCLSWSRCLLRTLFCPLSQCARAVSCQSASMPSYQIYARADRCTHNALWCGKVGASTARPLCEPVSVACHLTQQRSSCNQTPAA